jgi:septum formation protein
VTLADATRGATSKRAASFISDAGRLLSRIVLASASPRRYDLLRSLGLHVDVLASGYDEAPVEGLEPPQLASFHAARKLNAVLRRRPDDAVVLAADTVVDLDGMALGKPRDAAEAAEMLERLSGRDHLVHTAFALSAPGAADVVAERATARVRFYPLQAEEIAEYVATGEPFDKAGAYGIQGRAASLIESIDGDYYTVMGLPLARVIRALRRLGFALPKTNEPAKG